MRQWSFPIGSLLGVPLRIHYLLPVVLVVQCLFYTANANSDRGHALAFALLVYGPILFLTVLIHEFGHSLAARCVGGHAHTILLWPLGGLAYCSHDAGPKADLWVTFAGPLTHVPQVGFWVLMAWLVNISDGLTPQGTEFKSSGFWESVIWSAIWLNVTVMIFNLCVPAYPLGGGRIFADLMLIAGIPTNTAAKIVIAVAVVVGVAMVVLGAFRVLLGTLGIFIGLFILLSTYELWKELEADRIEQHPLFKKGSSQDGTTMYSVETVPAQHRGPARV
eukprot:jgi/Ulvmu1/5435/UM022_0230.1